MASNKVINAETLQTLIQLIATEIKKKANNEHTHANYVTTDVFTSAVEGINSFQIELYNNMDELNAKKNEGKVNSHTIYFVADNEDDEANDLYHEFMYINGAFEKVGDTSVDLSEYATIEYVEGEVADAVAELDISKIGSFENLNENYKGEYSTIIDVFNDVMNAISGFSTSSLTDGTYTASLPELEADVVLATQDYVAKEIVDALTGGTVNLDDYALVNHTHDDFSDIIGLQDALDSKAVKTEVENALGTKATKDELTSGLGGKAELLHKHDMDDINGLADKFENHTHSISEVENLESTLESFADLNHEHESISEIIGLQDALDKKLEADDLNEINEALSKKADGTYVDQLVGNSAPLIHYHEISEVNQLQETLDAKADDTEVIEIMEALDTKAVKSEMDTALANKSDKGHKHVMADVTDLQGALDLKADITVMDAKLELKSETTHRHDDLYMPLYEFLTTDEATAMWNSAINS